MRCGLQIPSRPCQGQSSASRLRTPLSKRATRTCATGAAGAPRITQDLGNFVQFAIKQQIQFSQVRPDSGADGVRGVYATFPVSTGDTLIAVPRAAALVVAPHEPNPVKQMKDATWAALPWYAQLAVKLALEAAAGPSSAIQDFIRALPQSPPDLPVLWPEEEVLALQYPYLLAKVTQERQHWQDIYLACADGLASKGISRDMLVWALSCIRSRSFAGPHFKSPFKRKLALFSGLQALVLYQALAGGGEWLVGLLELVAVALPTAWAVNDAKAAASDVEYVVCPFIDFLNHSSRSQAECQYDWLRDQYRVVSDQAYRQGQQVFINYGSQSNDQLLQVYGFVEPGNKDDRYVLTRLEQWLLEGPLAQTLGKDVLEQELGRQRAMLGEVVVTAGGFDPEVLACIQSMLQRQAGRDPAQQSRDAVRAILADACERELGACSSTVQEDQEALRMLLDDVALARTCQYASETAAADTPAAGSATEPGVEAAAAAAALGDEEQLQAALEAEEQLHSDAASAYGEDSTAGLEASEEPSSCLEQPTPEARRMDASEAQQLLKEFPRREVILQFRIEKKKVLQDCIAQLRSR